jgi:hypothetical protein
MGDRIDDSVHAYLVRPLSFQAEFKRLALGGISGYGVNGSFNTFENRPIVLEKV